MKKFLIVLFCLVGGGFLLVLYGYSIPEVIRDLTLIVILSGAFYFITESQFAENARVGSLLRKHDKEAYETLGGKLIIADRQLPKD